MAGKTHLILPDSHAHPDFHNKRYGWAGQLIADIKPDVVVDIGDWADMPSLCTYDFGKKSYEGRRYKLDIEASLDAQEKFFAPLVAAKKKYPKFIKLIGNHDNRIEKAVSMDAKLDGTISIDDLQYKEYGWEVVPYDGSTPGIITVDGVSYAHYFVTGVMGKPVSGTHPAYQLLQKQYRTSVQGHIHVADHCIRNNGKRRHIHGLVVGVYQDYVADYAGVANDIWWRGLPVLHNVEDGDFEVEWISLRRIKEIYG